MSTTIHPSWYKSGSQVALAIMEGKHDDELESIANACKARLKVRFRKGQICLLRNTKSVELDGQKVVIEKVNQQSISVRLVDVGIGYNVPPRMLEALS